MMIGQHGGAAAAGGASADRSVVGSNEGRREPVDEGCSMEASSEEDEDDEPLSQEERLALSAFACAERGDAAELRRLAGRGVELGMVDEGGCSLAHEAAAGGQAGVVRLLGETTGDVLQRVRATLPAALPEQLRLEPTAAPGRQLSGAAKAAVPAAATGGAERARAGE